MTQRVTVNVVEVNRQRLVSLEGVIAALSEVVFAGERQPAGAEQLDPARQFLRALRGLLSQPLPEYRYPSELGQDVELEAPATELEQLAGELEAIADRFFPAGEPSEEREALDELAARLSHRARSR